MKILLDPQIYNNQVYGGISRYYTEIFSRLNENADIEILNPIIYSKNEYFLNSNLYGNRQKRYSFMLKVAAFFNISMKTKSKRLNDNSIKKDLLNQKFDLFIPTYYNPYFCDYIEDKPFVLTVYDMIHELFPQYFTNDTSLSLNKKVLIEKATKIIAVSNNTKKDILKFYPYIDENKIEVIYHGNSIIPIDSVKIEIPKKYILFVGDRMNYKNFIFFINSIKEILNEDKNLFVLCAGGNNFSNDETLFLKSLNIEDQIFQKKFSDDSELAFLYKNAICFVFPSEYEGFGIPVLESMACGCPIVLTNNSSFPEVAGEAGVYFNLNDSVDLKNKVELILNNNELRKEYILKGFEQVKKFNWSKATSECLKVYKDAIIS